MVSNFRDKTLNFQQLHARNEPHLKKKDMVKQIKRNSEAKRTVETDFILAHNVYARAEIPPTDKVELFIMICKI